MNDATIKRLNQINRGILPDHAAASTSRGASRGPWETLAAHLSAPLTVLDVGCGNGRFGVFHGRRFGTTE